MKRLCRCAGLLLSAAVLTGCGDREWPGSIEALLESRPEHFGVVTEDPARYRVQIIYTQIDRDEANRPTFRTFRYRVDPDEYFYPASTVKLPTAILVLEKLNDLGTGEIVDGDYLDRPKDFAVKNPLPLEDLHDVLLRLMFPEAVDDEHRFRLRDEDYRFLYRAMSSYPSEGGIDAYEDAVQYPDGYVKFLLFGGSARSIPDNIRIFNKVGDAYGFLTDGAYVVDFENGVEFLLAATVYTNANGVFNDGDYEYDEIGMPFLKNLGRAIYEIELARERPHEPDLARFQFDR